MTADLPSGSDHDGAISRRDFLRVTGLGVSTAAVGGFLGARGSNHRLAATETTSARSQAKHGGALTVGLTEGTSSDTVNPIFLVNNCDFARANALYDPLIRLERSGGTSLALATEITPNRDATEWTIRVRSDVEFHNGKSLTADDVIYSFVEMVNPKAPGSGAASLATLKAADIKKLDPLTCRLPFSQPFATLPSLLASYYYFIIPTDFDPHHPVGTGPYRYHSFEPGVTSIFLRNDNYWERGLPYTDSLTVEDIPDETTGVNAIMAGDIDCFDISSTVLINELEKSGVRVVVSRGGGFIPFVMNCSQPPFTDARVRQAFRLIVNRPEMLKLCYGDRGTIGNDVFSIWDPVYDHSLPQREQDIAQAKFLLRKAGQEHLTIELVTATIEPGTISQATVFAEQAKAAGVDVKLRQVTSTELFGANWLKWTFTQTYWYYTPYFAEVLQSTLPSSPIPETHFVNSRYDSLFKQAEASTSSSERTTIAHEMQVIDHELGGYIIPCFPPTLDAHTDRVGGVATSHLGLPFNNFDFKSLWLS